MAYVVLARKWRPKRFDDVVGQEHVTNTLANAISQGRVAHGYLFCGPRGVGKTTMARILAKALNCEQGPTPTPCNQCQACLDVDLGRGLDIIEVDGASTRGIDDVRELRENVRYAPTSGRTKVYIIDEVHMLTREAFNALLKTLEEPPPHVVFVMATTEPFKVPATILSRCQRFDFARIHPRAVMDRLAFIAQAESFQIQGDALALVARRSQGGLRDALSILDQVLASAEGEITVEMVNQVLGLLDSEFYFRLTDCLVDGDARGAIQLLDEVYHAGADLGELADEVARHLRNVMLLSLGQSMERLLEDLGPHEIARLREQASRISPNAAARLLEVALRTTGQAKRSEHLRLHLEMAMVELASLSKAAPLGEVVQRLDEMERRLASGGGSSPREGRDSSRAGESADSGKAGKERRRGFRSMTPPDDGGLEGDLSLESGHARDSILLAERSLAADGGSKGTAEGDEPIASLWGMTVETVKSRKMSIAAFMMDSRASRLDEKGRLVVEMDAAHSFHKSHLEEPENRRFIEGVIREVFGRSLKYVVVSGPTSRDFDSPAALAEAREGGVIPATSPKLNPYEIAKSDPKVQRVMELFDGEITQ